ncbi:hypothetical protein IJH26_00525 [Candidatus Saccharibacteria bacterium]|nr:hypothetical protein [Candidatus Saccharibacteria bacterium]
MPAENKTLTAIWRDENIDDYTVAYNYGTLDFYDGTSYVDTGLASFSTEFVHNNFTITTKVDNSTFVPNTYNNFNSVFSDMDESGVGDAYPGFVFRRNASNFRFAANASNATGEKYEENFNANQTITVSRIDDKILLNSVQAMDMSNLIRTFSSPLTFGASLDSSNAPFRFFKGQISGTTVSLVYSNEAAITIPYTANFSCPAKPANADSTSDFISGTEQNPDASTTNTGSTETNSNPENANNTDPSGLIATAVAASASAGILYAILKKKKDNEEDS